MGENLDHPKNFPSKKSESGIKDFPHKILIAPTYEDHQPGDLYWKCSCGREFREENCKSVYQSFRDSFLEHERAITLQAYVKKIQDWEKILDEIKDYSCNAYKCRNAPVGLVKLYDSQPYCRAHIDSFLNGGMKKQDVIWGTACAESLEVSEMQNSNSIKKKSDVAIFLSSHKELPLAYTGENGFATYKCSCGFELQMRVVTSMNLAMKVTRNNHFRTIFPNTQEQLFPHEVLMSENKSIENETVHSKGSIQIDKEPFTSKSKRKISTFIALIIMIVGVGIYANSENSKKLEEKRIANLEYSKSCFYIIDEDAAAKSGNVGSEIRKQNTIDFYSKVLSAPCVIWGDGNVLKNIYQGIDQNSPLWNSIVASYNYTLNRWNGQEPIYLRCSDGWSSPSIGKRGACSHHGGVTDGFDKRSSSSLLNQYSSAQIMFNINELN